MKLSRRSFLRTTAPLLAATRTWAQRPKKPNVVVIVSDDHGYAEMSCQGGDIPTPNLDAIAKNGVRFTDGYVSCPVCSPTRAGLMTGRYQQRFGHEFNPGPAQTAEDVFGLPLTEKTLADHMKALGYKTGMVGKWHLGYRAEFHPLKRGFDEFFGFLGGAHSYTDARADRANPILRGAEPVDEKEYLTDAFAREAVAFIERNRSAPFFLYLAFNAVHNPLQAIAKYRERVASLPGDERRKTFAAMLVALDDGVGAVMRKLRDLRIEEDTLVIFVADNGGPTPATTSRNHPLRGFKGQVLEGGIRVPFLMQWPGRVPRGAVYRQPVISLDILSTAVAAGGGTVPANVDGVDLVPYVSGRKQGSPHAALYWRFGEQQAIRKGDWKLLKSARDVWELYNLRDDIGESKDLASAEPGRVKELQPAWEAWNAQLAPPKWGRPRRNRRDPAARLLRRQRRAIR